MTLQTRDEDQILPDPKDYLRYYQLEKDPFSTESPFYFEPGSQSKTLDRLCHLCRFSDMILLITGKPGMGKTTLKQAICGRLDATVTASQVDATMMMTEEILLTEVARGFGLAVVDEMAAADLQSVISRYGDEMTQEGRVSLVVVDNAQELAEYPVRCLLELAVRGRIHLMLLADPGFAGRGEIRAVGEQIYRFDLEKFSRMDVAEYLKARFDRAGRESAPPFNGMQMDTIYRVSNGVPALINREAENLLAAMMSEGPGHRRLGLPMGHMAAVVAVGGVLVVAFLFRADLEGVDLNQVISEQPVAATQDVESTEFVTGRIEPAAKGSLQPMDEDSPVAEKIPSTTSDVADRAGRDAPAGGNTRPLTERTDTPLPPTKRTDMLQSIVAPMDMPEAPAERTDMLQSDVAPMDIPEAPAERTDMLQPPVESTNMRQPLARQEVIIPGAGSDTDTVGQKNKDTAGINHIRGQNPGPEAAAPDVALTDPISELVNSEKASIIESNVTFPYKTEGWLMNVAPDRYTLQLVGSRSEDRIIEFIEGQRNPAEFAYFETQHQNESWFVVVLGDYPDRRAALMAIGTLPSEIRAENPWARSFQSVQETIKQHRDRK